MTAKKTKKRAKKVVKAWGGYTDGKLDWRLEYASGGSIALLATYKTRREAKKQYEDVRRLTIIED